MELKNEIRKAIDEQLQRRKNALKKVETRNVVLGNIRTALIQIDDVCKVIVDIGRPSTVSRQPTFPSFLNRVPEQPEHNRTHFSFLFNSNYKCLLLQ